MDGGRESRQETSLRDFLDVVFRRKWIIVSILLLTTALVLVIDARQPQSWASTSRVLIRRGEQPTLLSQQVRTLGWEEEVASLLQVILSDEVFARARVHFADSVRANNLPADWVFNPGSVRADVIGESNVFAITYADARRDVVRLGCETVTIAFRDFYNQRQAPPGLTDFFAGELADTRAELESWRQRRNDFMNREKFYGAEETSKFLLGKIGGLESRLTQLNGDISSQDLRVANLEALQRKTGPELERELSFSMSQHVLQSGIVQNIKFSLQKLNLEREELAQMYTDKHPEVVSVDAQIADLHDDLKRQVENAYRVEKVTLSEMLARRAALVTELSQARKELDAVPDRERQVTEMDATIKNLEERQKLLLSRQGESEIAEAGRPEGDVSVLSKASRPYSKKTRDYVRLALGPLLSLIVGLGIAFFLESMDHSVKSRGEAEEYLHVAVLGTISDTGSSERKQAAGGEGG
jgi:uncharacterized protein involved in exopolysaccharide biosynthesis